MKVYCFYIHGDEIGKYRGINNTIRSIENMYYALYAFTVDKKIAKAFKKERLDSLFYMKVIEMSKEEFQIFLNKNYELELGIYQYLTEVVFHDNTRAVKNVNVLSTMHEHDLCVYNVDIGLLDDFNILNIFDSYENTNLEALSDELLYYLFEVLKLEGVYNLVYGFTEFHETNVFYNQLAIFCRLFHNTFNERGAFDASLEIL